MVVFLRPGSPNPLGGSSIAVSLSQRSGAKKQRMITHPGNWEVGEGRVGNLPTGCQPSEQPLMFEPRRRRGEVGHLSRIVPRQALWRRLMNPRWQRESLKNTKYQLNTSSTLICLRTMGAGRGTWDSSIEFCTAFCMSSSLNVPLRDI